MTDPNPLAALRRSDRPRSHGGTSEAELAIYAATERLLGEMPLGAVSVAQIIAEAGTSRATFYFYFSSKFAVVGGLLERVMDDIFERVAPFIRREESTPPQEALHTGLAAGVRMWAEHRPAMRAIHEHWNTTDELRSAWTRVVTLFTDAVAAEIERERAAGLARPGVDARRLAATLLWGTERALYVAGLGIDPNLPDETSALDGLEAVWSGALYGG